MNWDWEKLQEQRRRQSGAGGNGPNFREIQLNPKQFANIRLPNWKLLVVIAVLLWLASGIYTVGADEAGVVQRFGAYDRQTEPGLHYHLPYPIEQVTTPKITQVRRIEIGFRTSGSQNITEIPQESLMLTGDENIVDVKFIVQYKISDAAKFLFNLKNQTYTVKSAAEASMREVVGKNKIDGILTGEKRTIQMACRDTLQAVLDRYGSGIRVEAVQLQDVHPPRDVIDAFKDVASAREDKNRFVNEAQAYSNDILPKARGRAAAMINEAQAFRETQIRKAEGEAARFLSVLKEYNKARDVTRSRLYIETMEEVFSNPALEKIIMTDTALRGTVPYLPLDSARGRAGQRTLQNTNQGAN